MRLDDVSPREKARLRWSVVVFALLAGALEFTYLFGLLAVRYAFLRYRPPLISYEPIGRDLAYVALAVTLGGALTWWLFVAVGRRVSAVDGGFAAAISAFVSVLVAWAIPIALNPSALFEAPAPSVDPVGGVGYLFTFLITALLYYPAGWGALLVLTAWGGLYGAWLRRSLIKRRDAAAESGA
jgi:hypothetical protein